MKNDTPLISCVMPTYGRPAYVNEAVAMFLAQDYPAKELVILNDCPGQKFVFDHPEVRIENRDRRCPTLGDKRNETIEMARGEIIAVWDDDDVYLPWRLSHSLKEMRRNETAFYRPATFWAYWGKADLHENQSVDGWLNHALVLFEKNLWRKVGGYPSMGCGEDSSFFQKLHLMLGKQFITHEIHAHDRFFILRGRSLYKHTSICGGIKPLDVKPGLYHIEPSPIVDPVLRTVCKDLIQKHSLLNSDKVPESQSAPEKPLVSVCVSLKNRSRIFHEGRELAPFPRFVASLAEAARSLSSSYRIELVVADFHSDDWPLKSWILQVAGPLHVNIIVVDGPFSRGYGLNVAAEQAKGDYLFLCDADMVIPAELFTTGLVYLSNGEAFFPIYQFMKQDGSPGEWISYGYGNAMVTKKLFQETGGVPEFNSWGGEDDLFFESVQKKVRVNRCVIEGFRHQWHPEHVRYLHYCKKPRSDYRKVTLAQRARKASGTFMILKGKHPHWMGEIHLYSNGRMSRPGADWGSYYLWENSKIELVWDRWPKEILEWDERKGEYRDLTKPFTLKTHKSRH